MMTKEDRAKIEQGIVSLKLDIKTAKANKSDTDFGGDNDKGFCGELIFGLFLEDAGLEYDSVSEENLDHDFVVGNEIKAEVKANYNTYSDTVVIETGSFKDKDGWGFTCQADWLVMVDIENQKLVIFDWKKMKPMVEVWNKEYRRNQNKMTHGLYGDDWESSFIRVPKTVVKEFVIME